MKRLIFFWALFCVSVVGLAQNYQLQSVFIYSFTRYIVWPDEYNSGDFEILVLGESPLIAELKTMAEKKKVGDRSIKVTKINSPSEFRKSHIIIVTSEKSSSLDEVLGKVSAQPTLIVTDQPGLGAKGSVINFVIKNGKMAFEMNQANLTKHKLKAASELSRLAIII